MIPETDPSALTREVEMADERTSVNFIDALADGAQQGAKVAANVMVMLVAFIAAVVLFNKMLVGIGSPWTLQQMVGTAFTPVAYMLGIPWDEAVRVGPLLGTKTILNEFIAYVDLSAMQKGAEALSARTLMITTVALCGFANLASIAINIGGLTAMAPERKGEHRPSRLQGSHRSYAGKLADCGAGWADDVSLGRKQHGNGQLVCSKVQTRLFVSSLTPGVSFRDGLV